MSMMNNSASMSPSRFAAMRRRVWGQMFGQLIQSSRETAGLSIDETARLAGMEVSEWEAIEAGYVPTDTGQAPRHGRGARNGLEPDGQAGAVLPPGLGRITEPRGRILARVLINRYAHFLRGR